jgi:hypothetical protein
MSQYRNVRDALLLRIAAVEESLADREAALEAERRVSARRGAQIERLMALVSGRRARAPRARWFTWALLGLAPMIVLGVVARELLRAPASASAVSAASSSPLTLADPLPLPRAVVESEGESPAPERAARPATSERGDGTRSSSSEARLRLYRTEPAPRVLSGRGSPQEIRRFLLSCFLLGNDCRENLLDAIARGLDPTKTPSVETRGLVEVGEQLAERCRKQGDYECASRALRVVDRWRAAQHHE